MWKQGPWLLALGLSPLLGGLTVMEGQAVVAVLLALNFLTLAKDSQYISRPKGLIAYGWCLVLVLLLLPIIPLPMQWVQGLSPHAAELAQQFTPDPLTIADRIPMSLSGSATIQRLWELVLMGSFFFFARQLARKPNQLGPLIFTMVLSLLCVGLSDVAFRLGGKQKYLGLWDAGWGEGAGTFANRNHFANWIYISIVFLLAWVIRSYSPLANRPSRRESSTQSPSPSLTIAFVGCMLFALIMAVSTGSRGGLIAFMFGIATWVLVLIGRSKARQRWNLAILIGSVAFIVILLTGDYLIGRILNMNLSWLDQYPKLSIWLDASKLILLFPWFGVGLGNFYQAFNHYKSIGSGTVIWHVENDWIQMFIEMGVLNFVLVVILSAIWLRRHVPLLRLQKRLPQPEMIFGAFAACAAFLCHAVFEFVFQIPANGALFATLLGVLAGCLNPVDPNPVPEVVPRHRFALNLLLATAFLVVASLNLAASIPWFRIRVLDNMESDAASQQALTQSVHRWPWGTTDRWIALARLSIRFSDLLPQEEQIERIAQARVWLTEGLEREPMNWKLRMERLWLDLAYHPDVEQNIKEAQRLVALYPLQKEIPLRLARHFAESHPEVAMDFLKQIDVQSGETLAEVLEIAWQCTQNTGALWNLTPNNPRALKVLATFAESIGLKPMALTAYKRLRGQVDSVELAKTFFRLGESRLAADLLEQHTPRARETKRLLVQCYMDLGLYPQALQLGESLLSTPLIIPSRIDVSPMESAKARWLADPTNPDSARALAASIYWQDSSGEHASTMRQLARRFPEDPMLQWIDYQWLLNRKSYAEAAKTLMALVRNQQGN